jgi:hypothetical protein
MTYTYIPLDSIESAELTDTNAILPKATYEDLVKLIKEAVEHLPKEQQKLSESRSHKAISIDGERGTGKTSVLVNLKNFIKQTNEALLNDIHILDPIDPTLLEDGESLFLHVIVAAVLHDETIKQAQARNVEYSRYFSQCLEKLANALESVDIQQEQRGMDKIRSLYGNKHLANCVAEFFLSTLKLIGKKLIVLPIDDIDTSLNLAFENLEIIRRYLVSPYVLPIVSGDRRLYDEVCWRDFHGRLTKDSSYKKNEAYNIAQELANEYQRKILPLPRRLSMPTVNTYWDENANVYLGKIDGMQLNNFVAWLEIFIAGPVNGLENSKLPLPIPSIRALTQFISHCGELIGKLPPPIKQAENSLAVQRLWQMPNIPLSAIDAFYKKYREISALKQRDYEPAYQTYKDEVQKTDNPNLGAVGKMSPEMISDWVDSLMTYFQHEPKAGALNLTLQAKQHWLSWSVNNDRQNSIFSTPLFQPLIHSLQFKFYDKQSDLSDWKTHLEGKLPPGWLAELNGQKTLLPYPVPEIGVNSALSWEYWQNVNDHKAITETNEANEAISKELKSKAIFLLSTLTHRNYYTSNKRSMMLNIGRIFEVIIASLVYKPESDHLDSIRQRAPFYSTSDVAPTKTLKFDEESTKSKSREKSFEEAPDMPIEIFNDITTSWQKLCEDIIRWREDYKVDQLNISPWLVYKVFNKVFSQIANNEYHANGMKEIDIALNIAGKVFYATWSAFGSFEKGLVFGLPTIIATNNINSSRNFEKNDHYSQNVGPFAPRKDSESQAAEVRDAYGKNSRAVSYVLSAHPLRKWIDDVLKFDWKFQEVQQSEQHNSSIFKAKKVSKSKEALCKLLSLNEGKRLTEPSISAAIQKLNWTKQQYETHLESLREKFSNKELKTFIAAGSVVLEKGNN